MNHEMYASARAMLAAMAERRTTSVALVEAALERAHACNPRLNALVYLDVDGALERAAHADRQRARGDARGALLGLPVSVKDTIAVAGMPCTAGVAALRDHYPAVHAPAVQRLVAAGAVVIGKSNVPPFAGDLQTDNALFGATLNPWDPGRNAGGSSGGAAAAVAAGIVPLELGSDLAGSLRIPAHACGVSALRPTTGAVDAGGQLMGVAFRRHPPHMLALGPLARDCGDLALAWSVLSGRPASVSAPTDGRLDGMRGLAWLQDPEAAVEPAVHAVLTTALSRLRAAGLEVCEAAPVAEPARMFELFLRLMYAALAAEFPDSAWHRCIAAAAPAPAAERRLPGLMAPAVTIRHRDWLRLREVQATLSVAASALLARRGPLLCPVLHRTAWPTDARPLAERDCVLGGEPRAWMQQAFWTALPSLAGLPAVVIPAGLDDTGLPVGLQLIGAVDQDVELLDTATRISAALWPEGPPTPP